MLSIVQNCTLVIGNIVVCSIADPEPNPVRIGSGSLDRNIAILEFTASYVDFLCENRCHLFTKKSMYSKHEPRKFLQNK
jgi:hypothetical protein